MTDNKHCNDGKQHKCLTNLVTLSFILTAINVSLKDYESYNICKEILNFIETIDTVISMKLCISFANHITITTLVDHESPDDCRFLFSPFFTGYMNVIVEEC